MVCEMHTVTTIIKQTTTAVLLTATLVAITPAFAEEVYLIRGYADVFSAGMNQMTSRLKKSGVNASVHSSGEWRHLAKSIISREKEGKVSHPIVIVGHSLGGVEAPLFANALAQGGVKVALVIGLDPGFKEPVAFGPNIKQVVNYKIPSGQNYRRGRGFTGRLSTINVGKYGVDHVGIDKNPQVQHQVMSRIRRKVGK
jgi:triacylglycerol esterase/lipase EstA (alpha/beta hydrolase family)